MTPDRPNGDITKFSAYLFRLITPVMLAGCLFILNDINARIVMLDSKVFTHMTNHEIHTPRADLVKLQADLNENFRYFFEELQNQQKGDNNVRPSRRY